MSLSQNIRKLRYARGWGADDLARHAKISRTALYQIESGRTTLPHAGTLQRIARALGVKPHELLEKAPSAPAPSRGERVRVTHTEIPSPPPPASDLSREIEIERKFRVLLRSPLRDAVVRIVEESFRLLPEAHVGAF